MPNIYSWESGVETSQLLPCGHVPTGPHGQYIRLDPWPRLSRRRGLPTNCCPDDFSDSPVSTLTPSDRICHIYFCSGTMTADLWHTVHPRPRGMTAAGSHSLGCDLLQDVLILRYNPTWCLSGQALDVTSHFSRHGWSGGEAVLPWLDAGAGCLLRIVYCKSPSAPMQLYTVSKRAYLGLWQSADFVPGLQLAEDRDYTANHDGGYQSTGAHARCWRPQFAFPCKPRFEMASNIWRACHHH